MARLPSVVLPDGNRVKKYSLAGNNDAHERADPLYPEPAMFTLYTAANGHCKTLSMVSYLANCHANGFRVVATDNLELKFGETFDYQRFLNNEYQGAVLAIDELEEYADALRYQSDDNLDLVGVIIQMRHELNEIVATTQFPGEVLSRLRRRVNWEVQCFDPGWGDPRAAGRDVYQIWRSNPFNDMARSRVEKREVHSAEEFWPLYNTHSHISVGSIRRAGKQRAAIVEINERNMVWRAMWGAVVKNNRPHEIDGVEHPTVAAGEVQMALANNDPAVIMSVKKIGKYLGELGADHYREGIKGRRWAIPRALFADAPDADDDAPQAAD